MKSPDEMENRLETDFNNEGKAGRGNAIEEQNEPEVMPKAKRQRKNKAARGSLSEKLSALFDFSEEAELAKAEKKAEAVEAARREAKLCAKKVKAAGERYSLALEEKENGRMKSSQLKAYAKDVKKLHTKAVGATKKYRRLKKQSQKKLGGFTSVLVTIDIFAAICFFVFYGPFASFRDTYITTAMSTSSHRYLANIFYSQATIDRVVSENTFIGTGLYTDASAIKFTDVDSITSYSTVYEEQILKKDEGNDLYKLLEFDGATYHGYIVVLYDASRITNVLSSSLSSGGQMLTEIAAENEAIIAINSGGFNRLSNSHAVMPQGNYIVNGEVVYSTYESGPIIGFTNENILMLMSATAEEAVKKGIRSGVEFEPFLIVNGVPATITGDGGDGKRPRTILAQRQDGIVLMFVVDGKWNGTGISLPELMEILQLYKCYNAANLDGGGSTTLVINGELINSPAGWGYTGERYLADAWIVK